MKTRPWCGALLLIPAVWIPGRADAQGPVRLDRFNGEVGFGFDGRWAAAALVDASAHQAYEEWAQIRLGGSIVDPGLLSFGLALGPVWRQRALQGVPGADDSGRANRLNFVGHLNALSRAPVRLSFQGRRYWGEELDPYGVTRRGTQAVLGAVAEYPNPLFTVTALRFERRSTSRTRQRFGTINQEEDGELTTVRLRAENRKSRVLIERIRLDDRAFDRDFGAWRTELNHRLLWGRGSRLRSTFGYHKRGGEGTYTSRIWSQSAHLQHGRLVSSDYRYDLTDRRGGAATSTGWRWNVAGRYQPVARLNLGVQGSGRVNDYAISREQLYEAQARLDFSTRLPFESELRVGGSVGNAWLERETTRNGRVDVVAERHVIDASRRFVLDNPFVEPGSVTIGNVTGALLYEPGFDYTLVDSGSLTEVLVLPAGRLVVGDTVLVDYTFEAIPSGSDRFRTFTFGGTFRLPAVAISHHRIVRRDGNGQPGVGVTLAHSDEIRTRLEVNLRTRLGRVDVSAQRLLTRRDPFQATHYFFQGGLSFAVRPNVHGDLHLKGTVRRDDTRPYETMSGDAGLRWVPSPWLQLDARLGAWALYRREETDQKSLIGGLTAVSSWRRLTLRLRYDHLAFSEVTQRTEDRLAVDVARRF